MNYDCSNPNGEDAWPAYQAAGKLRPALLGGVEARLSTSDPLPPWLG